MAWTCCQCFPCGGGQRQQPLGRNPRCACDASRNSFLGSRPPRKAPLPERSRSGQWKNRQWSPLIRSHTRAQGLLELITPAQSEMRSLAQSHWAGIWACHTLVPNGTIIVTLGQMTGEENKYGAHNQVIFMPGWAKSLWRGNPTTTSWSTIQRLCHEGGTVYQNLVRDDKWCTWLHYLPCPWSKCVLCVGYQEKKVWIDGKNI